ncbi:MAG TPA: GAF domain-containing protein, partial [Chloroflexi bacterium]|nr:GAF domain-containing protein [Chloroflexota bacterium]
EWTQFLEERPEDLRIEYQPGALPGGGNGATIEMPIALRGQAIGSLKLEDTDPKREWSEDESALVEAVSEQLALTMENLRLFEDTQQQATREQLTRQITDKMRAAPDIDSIIESGLSALAGALNAPRAYVKLTSREKPNDEHNPKQAS